MPITIIVKSVDEDTISLPSRLMKLLHLKDGDVVKAVLEGETLRLSRLENFLKLRGALANDDAFDEAITLLNQAWQ